MVSTWRCSANNDTPEYVQIDMVTLSETRDLGFADQSGQKLRNVNYAMFRDIFSKTKPCIRLEKSWHTLWILNS